MATWSHHGRALLCLAQHSDLRLRDLAARLGITERRAFDLVHDLSEAGYVIKEKDGRRKTYRRAGTPAPSRWAQRPHPFWRPSSEKRPLNDRGVPVSVLEGARVDFERGPSRYVPELREVGIVQTDATMGDRCARRADQCVVVRGNGAVNGDDGVA
jgi:hypothetical protein